MITLFSSLVKSLFRESAYQKTLRQLNNMTDRELSDIGIVRSDIDTVAREACKEARKPTSNIDLIEVHP
jgi:uncharacterized protein YjiS (DUF1127 family)